MADRLYIFDTTLRDGEQSPGATMNIHEKVQLARQLEMVGVDIMEAGFPAASKGDFEAVKTIAATVKNAQVAGLCRAVQPDIDHAWAAIRNAAHPSIHTFIATSPVHMQYKLRKSPEQVLEMARDAVRYAAGLCSNVEFSAEDASRSDWDFLTRVVETAIDAGATTINIPDTVGYAQPDEFGALVRYVMENARNSHKAVFSVHCHNDLGLAVANTLAALKAGARQAEVTVSGIGERAGNAALEELVMALRTRHAYYDMETGIKSEQLFPACRLLSMIIGQPIPANKAIVGANAFAHESGIHQDGMLKNRETYEIMTPESVGRTKTEIVLGKHSGRNAINGKLEELGYRLTPEQTQLVFDAVKKLADRKKQIYDEDMEALVLEEVFRIPDMFRLVHLSVQASDTGVPPSAAIVMEVGGERRQHTTFGVGPIDAVFNAISQIVGRAPQLRHYSVNAITGGTDAQGEVTVKLQENGSAAVGRGADADIITASAKAYLNALNRLAKKEQEDK
jgi:2-isopropylmalate synthase